MSSDRVDAMALVDLAARMGFGHAVEYREAATLPETMLTFFLIDGRVPDATKHQLLRSIRSSSAPLRKYAPIICVLANGPRHRAVPLVEMGFDDVLFLVDPVGAMSSQIAAQLHHELVYVQTAHYFGPDRRRIELIDRADPRRKPGAASGIRKFKVVRDPARGVEVSPAS